MTKEEIVAYGWASRQKYNSVAANYARVLANYIARNLTADAEQISMEEKGEKDERG